MITKRKQPLEDMVLSLTHTDQPTPAIESTPEQLMTMFKVLSNLHKRAKHQSVDLYAAPELEEGWGKWAKFRKNWVDTELNPLCSGTFDEIRKENKKFLLDKRTPHEVEMDNLFIRRMYESNEKWKKEQESK
jgi:hypothetical protein